MGPRYDVVSIAPNKSESGNSGMTTVGATFSAENTSLQTLISSAYGIRSGLISGLPRWADGARYNVNGKIVDPDVAALKKLTKEQREAMLAAVLEDRFQVKVHTETKQMPVYDLVIAKNGPKLKETPPAKASEGGPAPEKGSRGGYSTNDTELTATALQISSLAEWLSGKFNRTILDKTGLTGEYDFHSTFSADTAELSGEDDGRQSKGDAAAPSLFTALQEQIGLKLESTKGPVKTLMVDHAEPPSAN